jgi:quinol monooxygenase YgiN
VWRSQQEHDASLTTLGAQAAISQVLPLLAGSPEKIDVLPVGGKGFPLA